MRFHELFHWYSINAFDDGGTNLVDKSIYLYQLVEKLGAEEADHLHAKSMIY